MTKTLAKKTELTVAENLYGIQQQIAFLQEQEDTLKAELLGNLKEQGVTFVKLENGTTFTRSHRETLKAIDVEKATAWAEKNYCMKIDTTKAMKILRRELKMPKFFTRVIGEDYLTVKKVGVQEETD